MEFTGIQKFKAMNDKLTNLRDCEGLVIRPIGFHTSHYEDADGKDHAKLVIYNANDKKMYKTEVKAFIEKFMQYDESFGDMSDDEKPEIVVTLTLSKKGNKYVNFDLIEPAAD